MTTEKEIIEDSLEVVEDFLDISFDDLQKQEDVFIDDAPVKKEVVWKKKVGNGYRNYNFNVFIRKQNFGIFANYLDSTEDNKTQSFKVLSESLSKDASGKQNLLTIETAKKLHPELAIILLTAINEVNTKKN